MTIRTLSGVIIGTTPKSLHMDFGGNSEVSAWIPRSQIITQEQDALYPEMTILTIPAWLPIKLRKHPVDRFDPNRFEAF